MTRFRIQVRGLEEVRRDILARRDRLQNMAPAWMMVAQWLAKTVREEQFDSEGRRFETPWMPRVNDREPGRALLVKTGTLRRGFIPLWTQKSAKVYNPVDYASYHQEGTARMVARPFFPKILPAEDEEYIRETLRRWIVGE